MSFEFKYDSLQKFIRKKSKNICRMKFVAVLSVVLSVKAQHQCKKPLAAKSYSSEKMEGFWYEIARFQTLGGSVFQHGKVCTGFTFTPYGAEARVEYTSRVESPEAGFQKNCLFYKKMRIQVNKEMKTK